MWQTRVRYRRPAHAIPGCRSGTRAVRGWRRSRSYWCYPLPEIARIEVRLDRRHHQHQRRERPERDAGLDVREVPELDERDQRAEHEHLDHAPALRELEQPEHGAEMGCGAI